MAPVSDHLKERKTRRKGLRIGKALSIASKTARLPARIVTAGYGSGRSKLVPSPGEQAAAILRVRVLRCQDLLGKDRGGTSDPFVIVIFGKQRFQTPTVKRNVNPTYDAKASTFDFPLYLSLAEHLGSLEFVVWDKDIMRKEYLGEASVAVEDWFPTENGVRAPLAFSDAGNHARAYPLLSSRRAKHATGSVTVKIGLIPATLTKEAENFESIYSEFVRRMKESSPNLLSAPATEGIGTLPVQEEDEEYADDGLSSDEESEDEVSELLQGRDILTDLGAPTVPNTPNPDGARTPSLLKPSLPPSSYFPTILAPAPRRQSSADSRVFIQPPSPLPPSRPKSTEPVTPGKAPRGRGPVTAPSTPGMNTPGTSTPGAGKQKRPIFKRGRGSRATFNLTAQKDILGIVMLEVSQAEDLPKIKNSTGFGWDMDPFTVVSFGKKVFRTRVIRHSLNPKWEEKLLFHVRRYESTFKVHFTVLDWDKLTSNDHVGDASLDLNELMAGVPEPDLETGLYRPDSIGTHDMKEFRLRLTTTKGASWEGKHAPVLTVRAKYQPYDALRQRFWRQYLKQYDANENERFSKLELTSMLDSLGSTLTKETVDGFYTRYGKSGDDDEISLEQAIYCLEEEVCRPEHQKRIVFRSDSMSELGPQTPGTPGTALATPAVELTGLDFSGYSATPADNESAMMTAIENSRPGAEPYNNEPNQQPLEKSLAGVYGSATSISSFSGTDVDDVSPPRQEHVERVINIRTCPLCHRPRLNSRAEVDIVTHLAVCASTDWGKVDRMIVGNFVTASQAQRKWLAKAFSTSLTGSYRIGANSANIIVQNRMTGQLEEEKMQVYVRLGIRLLYKAARSRMEGARARRLLKSMSIKQGLKYDSPNSVRDILPFIAFHNLNMDEVRDPLSSFKTFNQFFYRKLAEGVRPVSNPNDPSTLVSCADCRMMAFESVTAATKLWIKGRDFTVKKLLGETYKHEAPRYEGGAVGIFRLAPQDYHRFHSPVDGVIGPMTYISGEYYTVNPQAIRTALDVYGENARKIVPIDSPSFGRVMAVCVGAMMVGSIITTVKEGEHVARGQEFGYFAFGGSTIVLLFEKDVVDWDEDLLINGRASLETLVRMGMRVGKSRRGSHSQ